jgi:cobalt/nickel transport system permease protein
MVCIALIHSPAGLIPALGGTVGLALLARLPWSWARGQLSATALLLALFALPLPFLVRQGPMLDLGPVSLSQEGIRLGVLVAGKGLAVVLVGLVLLTTAPLEVTLKAAHALRVPGLLVQLVLLSYRYLFLLADELTRLRVAVRTRGYRNAATWHSYRTVGNLAGTLLVRGSERAERVASALRCRGFDGRFRSLVEFHTTSRDVLAFVLLALLAGAVVWVGGLPG